MTKTDNVLQAIEYIHRGWFVFPCREKPSKPFMKNGKEVIRRPKAPYAKGGHVVATNDIQTATEWWKKFPYAAIGVSCEQSNLVVIDIDRKNGVNGLDTWINLEISDAGALHSLSPNNGTHIIFTGSTNSYANVKSGIDVRGVGAYFIAPPSKLFDEYGKLIGQYKAIGDWSKIPAQLPEELVERLNLLRYDGRVIDEIKKDYGTQDHRTMVRRAKEALEVLPDLYCDEYFRWVSVGMSLKSLGQDGFALWDRWSRKSSKYDKDGCSDRWETFNPTKITIGSLFYWAKQEKENAKK